MKYRFLIIILLFVMSASSTPAFSQNLLQKWFPTIFPYDDGPRPEDTLIAPFADPVLLEKSKGLPVGVLPENAVSLDKPHRSSRQIGDWVLREATSALTFPDSAFDASMAEKKKLFSDEGWAQYKNFLTQAKIPQTIKSGQYKTQSYSNEKPLLLNEGVVNGSHKWQFDAPLTVSYLKAGMTDYSKAKAVNQDMMLRIQVGRYANAPNETGILIDQWVGRTSSKK